MFVYTCACISHINSLTFLIAFRKYPKFMKINKLFFIIVLLALWKNK